MLFYNSNLVTDNILHDVHIKKQNTLEIYSDENYKRDQIFKFHDLLLLFDKIKTNYI
jgi:hypothetical protein